MTSSVNAVSAITVAPDSIMTGDIIVNPGSITSCCSINIMSIVFTFNIVPWKT